MQVQVCNCGSCAGGALFSYKATARWRGGNGLKVVVWSRVFRMAGKPTTASCRAAKRQVDPSFLRRGVVGVRGPNLRHRFITEWTDS